MVNAGLYVRVSSTKQAEEGYSIGEQTERLTKYSEAMGWNVYRIYTDAGFTGANIKRPALEELLKDVKAKRIDKVVVYKLDRLSRSQKDTLSLIEDNFLKNNVDFVSLSENFDTGTAFGRAAIGLIACFAQLEREQIKERMQMGHIARYKSGKHTPTRNIPPGYNYANGLLIVNEEEAQMVRKAFELAKCRWTPARIAKELSDMGMVAKSREWNERNVRHCLRSRIYIGEVNYGKEWSPGIHDPIVDRETFEEVQMFLDERKDAHTYKGQRDGKVVSILGGLIYCGKCGGKYTFRNVKSKNGKEYKQYVCNSRRKVKRVRVWAPGCRNKNWNAEELEKLVCGEVRKLAADPEWIEEESPKDNERLLSIEKGIKKAEGEISRMIDLYAVGDVPVEVVKARIQQAQERKEKLEEEAAQLRRPPRMSKEKAFRRAESFGDVLDHGSFQDIRDVLTDLIDKIVVDDDDITIYWRFG